MHPLSDPNVVKASCEVGDEVTLDAGEGGKCLHFLQVGSRRLRYGCEHRG